MIENKSLFHQDKSNLDIPKVEEELIEKNISDEIENVNEENKDAELEGSVKENVKKDINFEEMLINEEEDKDIDFYFNDGDEIKEEESDLPKGVL